MLLNELDEEKNCNKGYVLGNEYVGMWESGESSTISSNNNNSTSYSYYLTDEHGYTIHEAFDPLTQSPPGLINATYNHDGGVSEKKNGSKNNSCRKKGA